jgi:hypothetical protein
VQIMHFRTLQFPPVFFHLVRLRPIIFLIILLSNTLLLRSANSVSDKVSHPYKAIGKMYISANFNVLYRKKDDKFLDRMVVGIL